MAKRPPRKSTALDVGPESGRDTHTDLTSSAAAIRQAHVAVRKAAAELARCALDAGELLAEAKTAIDGPAAWQDFVVSAGISMRLSRRYAAIAAAGMKPHEIAMGGLVAALCHLAIPPSGGDE